MGLADLTGLKPGITSVIGGGGKTTFLRKVGEELAETHSVLLCTTTKILPFSEVPFASDPGELEAWSQRHALVCTGTPIPGTEKLKAPGVSFEILRSWFDYVLVEADGAAHHPLKAHASYEPVIPPESRQVICIVGASGFGQTVREAAHRPERYAELAEITLDSIVTPEAAVRVLRKEALHDFVFVNQADSEREYRLAAQLSEYLREPVCAGSLLKGEYEICG